MGVAALSCLIGEEGDSPSAAFGRETSSGEKTSRRGGYSTYPSGNLYSVYWNVGLDVSSSLEEKGGLTKARKSTDTDPH